MNTGKEDIPVMLDCLQELFDRYGDKVTPTLLVELMESKLHRRLVCMLSLTSIRLRGLLPKGYREQAAIIASFPTMNYWRKNKPSIVRSIR